MSDPCFLYRHYDKDDGLLYVGISNDPDRRLREHREITAWAWLVVRTETVEFPSREEAHAAERQAVRDEFPEHNRTRFRGGDGDWRAIKDPQARLAARQALINSAFEKWNRRSREQREAAEQAAPLT